MYRLAMELETACSCGCNIAFLKHMTKNRRAEAFSGSNEKG